MNPPPALVLLPYIANIAVKFAGLTVDRQLIAGVLEQLFSHPRPGTGQMSFTNDQQQVIVKHICHVTLKSTTVITTFTSLIAAFLVVLEFRTTIWLAWILPVFVIIGAGLLGWVLPKRVYYFGTRGLFGMRRDVLAVLSFCAYDGVLALTSPWAVQHHGG